MQKILILSERFHPEEFIINDLAAEWQKMGVEVTVLTQQPSYPFGKVYSNYKNKLFNTEKWNNIKIHRFFTISGYQKSLFCKIFNYLSFVITGIVFTVIIGRKFDKIFVFQTGPLTQAIPAIIAKKIWRKQKISIWTLDVWPDTVFAYGFKKNRVLVWFLDKLVKFIYRNCTNIFISCKGFKDIILPYCNGQKIEYCPNWPILNSSAITNGEIDFPQGTNFTFTGNIGKVQNLENIISGFELFNKEQSNCFLHLVGDGSNVENLKAIVSQKKISNVIFWGRRPAEEMAEFYKQSDILIIALTNKPIFSLTVPLKFQAYLTAKKPIFCAVNGEVKRLTLDNNLGLYANPDDIQEIASTFKRFYNLKQNNQLNEFSNNSSKLLDNEFNRDTIIRRMLKTIFS